MQHPLPNGTILQHRYRLVGVLGQGGFGRTYLAEDQGRFNELCVLKEFTPPQLGIEELRKAKELFQKEAEILYRIKHPQVPDFRATFEQNGRLFLVEQYVEGKTYRELLDDRKSRGLVFSELEGLRLLEQMLNVLKYLHDQNIIHRDIAPDNIICREPDQLPVLIDFGAVKEVATRFSQPSVHTRIGKDYYAAPEQIQFGQAFRSSDLYSLAVTIVVLLTGQEPERLYDPDARQWRWQTGGPISPKLAAIFNQMLRYEASDRYQSADEIIPLLTSITAPKGNAPLPAAPATANQPTVNVVGQVPRAVVATRTHSNWSKILIGTGHILKRVTVKLTRLLWGTIRWTSTATIDLLGGVLRTILKWAIVSLIVIGLIRWGWTSLVQQSKQWFPQPKIESPKIELPKIEFPPIKLPAIELPKIELPDAKPTFPGLPPLSDTQRREDLRNRLNQLNIDTVCFTGLVDDRFYGNHPELVNGNDRVTLSDDRKDEELRTEWFSIAERLLKNPRRYADCKIPQ